MLIRCVTQTCLEVSSEYIFYKAGIVAGYAVVTRSLNFRIRAAPAQMHTYLMFNAKYGLAD